MHCRALQDSAQCNTLSYNSAVVNNLYLSTEHWYVPVMFSCTLVMERVRWGEEERDISAEGIRFVILEHKSAIIPWCCLTCVWCREGVGEKEVGQS